MARHSKTLRTGSQRFRRAQSPCPPGGACEAANTTRPLTAATASSRSSCDSFAASPPSTWTATRAGSSRSTCPDSTPHGSALRLPWIFRLCDLRIEPCSLIPTPASRTQLQETRPPIHVQCVFLITRSRGGQYRDRSSDTSAFRAIRTTSRPSLKSILFSRLTWIFRTGPSPNPTRSTRYGRGRDVTTIPARLIAVKRRVQKPCHIGARSALGTPVRNCTPRETQP